MSYKIIVLLMAFILGSSSVSAATYTWNGSHSSDWSDPLNWDGNAAPTDGNDVTLTSAGTYLPTNQDIQDLKVVKLNLGSGYPDRKLTIKGKTLWISGPVKDACTSAADTVDFTFENDIVLNANGVSFELAGDNGRTYDSRLFFKGDVKDNGTNVPVKFYSGGYGSKYLVGPKSFRGTTYANTGFICFDEDAALGVQTLGSGDYAYSLNSNCGNFEAFLTPGCHYRHLTLPAYRTLKFNQGWMHVEPGVEFTLPGDMGSGIGYLAQSRAGAEVARPAIIHLTGSSPLVKQLKIGGGALVIQESANAWGASDSYSLYSQWGTYDFNGYDSNRPLSNHTQGLQISGTYGRASNFVNNNLSSESAITKTVTIGFRDAHSMFGGLGDIRITGDIVPGGTYEFSYTDPGRLTFAGANLRWGNSTTFSNGEVVFDNTVYNTSKLASVATAKNLTLCGGAKLRLVGNDSAETKDYIGTLNHSDPAPGSVSIETVAGNADCTLVISNLAANADVAVNFVCKTNGTGKARIVLPNAANDASFGGLWIGAIWNDGESYAKVDANGVVCGMADSEFNTTFTSGSNWDVPAGNVTCAGGVVRGMRFNASSGTSLTLSGKLQMPVKLAQPVGLLMTPKSGDVTITGGSLDLNDYHHALVLAQFNTNHHLRLETKVTKTVNSWLQAFGPGETQLVNDANDYDGCTAIYGGAKLSFTSVANGGTLSSLGSGAWHNEIYLGNGSTLNYIGTDAAGHSTDRPIHLRGKTTISANGAGPLVLNGPVTNYVALQRYATPAVTSRLVLSGSGEGVVNGSINPGTLGMVVKEGSGTWTINGDQDRFFYPVEVKAGTLALNGAITAGVVVRSGATLKTSGLEMNRDLELAGALSFDPDAGAAVTVWGKAKLSGDLRFTRRPAEPMTLLVAKNGIEGTFSTVPNGIKVKYAADSVTVAPVKGLFVLVL